MIGKFVFITSLICLVTHSIEIDAHKTEGRFIDSHIESIKGDGRDPEIRSAFETMRMAYEAAEEKGVSVEDYFNEHPLLS